MTAQPARRHTCPGAHGGITPEQCAAKGCCFSDIHCNISCPWCFTPEQEYGPNQFHNDADHIVFVKESDPLVPWYIQGWWGHPPATLRNRCSTGSPDNCFCHCEIVNDSSVFPHKLHLPYDFLTNRSDGCAGNNGLAMLQPDNVTVIQTQPAYRCQHGGPLLSKSGADSHVGCPQPHPLTVDITSGGPETALGAHGGSGVLAVEPPQIVVVTAVSPSMQLCSVLVTHLKSATVWPGLSALGGVIRLHEIPAEAPPIRHALKIELFAHEYYFGGGASRRELQKPTTANGGRTQYLWPATGSDAYRLRNINVLIKTLD
eukprot:SAG25_NODE_2383_length_1663_cov_8.076617_2_plen_316_part_00